MPSRAFSIHPPSVSASFKQGITMVRSVVSAIPKIYLEKDSLASLRPPLSLNFSSVPCVLRHNPQFRGPNGNDAAREWESVSPLSNVLGNDCRKPIHGNNTARVAFSKWRGTAAGLSARQRSASERQ